MKKTRIITILVLLLVVCGAFVAWRIVSNKMQLEQQKNTMTEMATTYASEIEQISLYLNIAQEDKVALSKIGENVIFSQYNTDNTVREGPINDSTLVDDILKPFFDNGCERITKQTKDVYFEFYSDKKSTSGIVYVYDVTGLEQSKLRANALMLEKISDQVYYYQLPVAQK